MKKVLLILAVISVGAIGGFFYPKKKAIISDFSWSMSGKNAPYSFRILNRTDEKLGILVVLEAQNVSEGNDGTTLYLIGQARIEVTLVQREERRIEGVIELTRPGSSATTVSYYASPLGQ